MLTIAEKLGLMKARTVKVCAKSGVGRKTGLKNLAFRMNLQENCLRKGNS